MPRALPLASFLAAASAVAGPLQAPGADPFGILEGHKGDAFAQTIVVPQRPGRNNVRWYDFEWQRYDYLDDHGVGGVRLYFYERERDVARVGAALVREQYELLSKRFNYRPTSQVPYILYNSHREFQNTNVFFVSEGVLGVTSPQDLRMALPFWGEVQRFREVSTHEMVHQFTIQKVAERAAAAGVESPVMMMPLWFIEGLAEFYAKDGIDLETDMFLRDMLLHPRVEFGYAAPGFWEDYPGAFLYTYKYGQARVAFLAEHFGEKTLQAILDQSPRLASVMRGSRSASAEREGFRELVSRLTSETPDVIAQRFSAWLKRRYLAQYLQSTQEPPVLAPVEIPGEPDAFSVGPDGLTMVYRSVERDSGRSRLMLVDRRSKAEPVQIAVDGVPGLESLHPVLRGVTSVGTSSVAYLARDGAADSLYVVPFQRMMDGPERSFTLGPQRRIDLSSVGVIEAGDPAMSPDESRVAFFGLDTRGHIDVFIADVATAKVVRITDDAYAERELSWVDEPPSDYGVASERGVRGSGTIVYAGDATSTGRFNLFALDPDSGARARLTDEPADHRHPFALGGGQVVFSSDARGKPDLHILDVPRRRIVRVTDFVTGVFAPATGPRGLSALAFYGGEYRILDVPSESLLALDARPSLDGELAPPRPIPEEQIPLDAPRYDPYATSNWRVENVYAAFGASGVPVGQSAIIFGDVLSDRSLLVQFSMQGTPSLTNAYAYYMDRSARDAVGGGIFHTVTQRRESNSPGFNGDVYYYQQEFGLTGMFSRPLDTFMRLEARGTFQGLLRNYQLSFDNQGFITTAVSVADLREWQRQRGALDLEGLGSLRFGYDTTMLRFPGGAFSGGSLLAEAGGGILPLRANMHAYVMLDGQYHLRIFGFSTLHMRASTGLATGSVFGRQFLLNSFDYLRNFNWGDQRLLGSFYATANLDWEISLDNVVRVAILSNVEGVLGLDFGGVSGRTSQAVQDRVSEWWANRTLAFVMGFNLGLGPFEMRFHYALPIDVGGYLQPDAWVPNISLRYAYL